MNLITIIFGRGAQFLLALATLKTATSLLSPEEMGKVSLTLTTAAFFAMLLVNPVGMFINRRLHAWQPNGLARIYLGLYTWYLVGVALIASMVLILLEMTGWIDFGIAIEWLIALVCGSLVFNTMNQTYIPSLNILGYRFSFVALTVATLAASLFFATIFAVASHGFAQYWLLGLLLGQILLAGFGRSVLYSKLNFISGNSDVIQRPIKRHLHTLFEFAWPVALAAGFGWVQGQGYRYLLESQLGLAQLGLFVAGYGMSAGFIAGFESVLTTYYQPRLYHAACQESQESKVEAWQRYASTIIPSLVLTVGLIMMLAPELTHLFLGDRFQVASSFVVWGALADSARVLIGVYSLIAHVFMRTRWLVFPTAVGALLAITLCGVLIEGFGAIGAGAGLVASGFAVVALMHIKLARRAGARISLPNLIFALLWIVALWPLTLWMRNVLDTSTWQGISEMMLLIGTLYFGMQFILLRQQLSEASLK